MCVFVNDRILFLLDLSHFSIDLNNMIYCNLTDKVVVGLFLTICRDTTCTGMCLGAKEISSHHLRSAKCLERYRIMSI